MTGSSSLTARQPSVNRLTSERPSAQTNVYYQPELDALRFFAFTLVFIHHVPIQRASLTAIVQAGAFGLPIFFCLSAYLIVTLLLKEKHRTGTVRVGWFAIRRILRIWPLYFGILAVGWVLGIIWPLIHLSGRQIAFFAVMLGNVWMLRHGWSGSPAGIVWSVSIEEQFYLGIPFLIRAGGRRAITLCCLLALVVAYVALLWLHHRGEDPALAPWASSFVQSQFFAAGGLLAVICERRQIRFPLSIRVAIFAASLLAYRAAAPIFLSGSLRAEIAGYLLILIGTSGILIATLHFPRPTPSSLAYLGRITYGAYVFHTTMLWFVFGSAFPPFQTYILSHRAQGALLTFLLTILCASLSFHYIERPILRLKDHFAVIHSASPETRQTAA